METPAFKFLLQFLLFILSVVCTSGSLLSGLKATKRVDEQTKHSYRRELIQTIQHDFMNPPITTYPTNPVTNPVNPPLITDPTTPVTNPVNPPTTPVTNPVNPPATPVTNPVTTPNPATVVTPPDTSTPPLFPIPPATATPNIPVTFPPVTDPINPPTPVTNPVTTPSTTIPGGQPVTTPAVAPPAITNAPAVPGQSWCVARGGLPETTTQVALDYACGLGGADCSAIQQSGSCYNPNTLQNHASYAFNSYYQKNPTQASCDFGGAAMITNLNPSTGSCVFTTSSSSSSSTSTNPITTPTPTPTTESSSGALPSSYGTPPNALSASSPALGGGIAGYGESPPTASISKASMSRSFRPFICCIFVVISIITGRIDFNI